MADSSSTEQSPDLGYSHDDLRHVVITATSFALILSTVSVILRLLCRVVTKTKMFLDDYLIIIALVGAPLQLKLLHILILSGL